MVTKDPFKPLIFIIVGFGIIYGLYSVFYKRRYFFDNAETTEYLTSTYFYDEQDLQETLNRSRRSSDQRISPSGQKGPLLILLLASNARSGSTVLAELLSTTGKSVHFFEPLKIFQNKKNSLKTRDAAEFLSDIFQCNFEEGYDTILRETLPFSQYFHPSIFDCMSGRSTQKCLKNLDLKSICQNARVRVAKVANARLSIAEKLLNNSSYPEVKVIYLTRDPRGSITSMQNLFWNWNPSVKCSQLWEDMLEYDRLAGKYPTKVISVTHEELSLYPIRTLKNLNRFLTGRPDISAETQSYINKHMYSTRYREHPRVTFTKSKNKYQSWRWNINGRLLSEIENDPMCRKAITKYGHKLFGSLDRVTDPRIPLDDSDKVSVEQVMEVWGQD